MLLTIRLAEEAEQAVPGQLVASRAGLALVCCFTHFLAVGNGETICPWKTHNSKATKKSLVAFKAIATLSALVVTYAMLDALYFGTLVAAL